MNEQHSYGSAVFSVNEIINEINKCAVDNDILFTLTKVKAHSGEFGNTKADKMAKNGLRSASMDPFISNLNRS